LVLAASRGHENICKLLLEADVSKIIFQCNCGQSALMISSVRSSSRKNYSVTEKNGARLDENHTSAQQLGISVELQLSEDDYTDFDDVSYAEQVLIWLRENGLESYVVKARGGMF